ncbi:glycerol-3-phosphate dehydrogenase subunit GlpB [Aestuariimicrobium sp. Y1814]|uniref:glycerol-3-phosphate dehydrogenase subunit GlpB n=1 Tax=Aestuariimicrobium sp. Y1814 TaxID=3418742 RepID=UPI003DA74364
MTENHMPITRTTLTGDRSAVVIGSGIAGLTTALGLAQQGVRVTVVTKGLGGLQLSQGTIDVLGYTGDQHHTLVPRPLDGFEDLPAEHPYRITGPEAVQQGITLLRDLLGPQELVGDANTNGLYPTAVGALRPTALVPRSMANGVVEQGKKFLIVGIHELKDYHPQLIAGNIARTPLPDGDPVEARHASFSLPRVDHEVDANPVQYARAMDNPDFRAKFAAKLKALVQPGETVGVPAVLGLNDPTVFDEVQDAIGAPLFEIVSQPPSVVGMRLNQALSMAAKTAGVRMMVGAEVVGVVAEGGAITGVTVKTAGRDRVIKTDWVVHCGGGFESGTLAVDSYNNVSETVLGLPVTATDAAELIHGDFWGEPQPLFKVGVRVDDSMRVLNDQGGPVHPNLLAAGGILAGSIRWEEKSGEGIALASAMKAVATISEGVAR